jgi:hypothetical protein
MKIEAITQHEVIDASPAVVYKVLTNSEAFAGKTRLTFSHLGFPQHEEEHLSSGWKARYGDPMRTFLAKR